MLEVTAVLAILAAIWILYLGGIISAARHPGYAYRAIGRRKPFTLTMVVLTGFIGGTYFLLRIRPQLRRAEADTATA